MIEFGRIIAEAKPAMLVMKLDADLKGARPVWTGRVMLFLLNKCETDDEILHYMYNPEAKWICSTLINALGHARQRTIVRNARNKDSLNIP